MATLTVGEPVLPAFDVGDLSVDVMLRYCGSTGRHSERLVTMHHLCGHLRADGTLRLEAVKGYCHTRNMPRTFAAARIEGLYDPRTGEVIADVLKWLGVNHAA